MHRKTRNRFLSQGCTSDARMNIYIQKSKSYYSVLLLFLVGRFTRASMVSLVYFSSKGFFLGNGGYPSPGLNGGIIVLADGLISSVYFLAASSAIFYKLLA